ncbi:unnamed protein product, partial [Brenthis ino]
MNQEGGNESEIERKKNDNEEGEGGDEIKKENSDNRNCGGKEQSQNTLYLVPVENEVLYPVDTYEVPIVYYL